MSANLEANLFDVLLDAWDRNHRILVHLLRAVPKEDLGARAVDGGPTVAQLFTHVHSVRLVFIEENVPGFPVQVPEVEWDDERDPVRIEAMLNDSAKAVREAVEHCVREGREMKRHYDHPILFLQMMIWHEGYHHGQIKLALKVAGRPLANEKVGGGTWGVWMRKTKQAS